MADRAGSCILNASPGKMHRRTAHTFDWFRVVVLAALGGCAVVLAAVV